MSELRREVEVLPGLAAELTCAICLELLQEPVTLPCGHNFCQDCLALYWADERVGTTGFSCPQCRCRWAQRPELRPNRVLCTVVAGVERARSEPEAKAEPEADAEPEASGPAVPCDACSPAAAAAAQRTCLTCLASFCAEHLEPHRQSPALRSHSLTLPLRDLAQRRCPCHGKLLEFRCHQHGECLCAVCLLEHRSCTTVTEEEARGQREEELKTEQKTVGYQILQLQHSLELMQFQKEHVKDSLMKQKSTVASEFAELKAMIEREEKVAAKLIEDEESKAEGKCVILLDQMSGQLEKLKEYKEQLNSVLGQTWGIAFWKSVAELPQVSLDAPTSQQQVEVDATRLLLITKAVSVLRGKLGQQLKFPLEQRVKQMEQAEKTNSKQPKSQPVECGSEPMESRGRQRGRQGRAGAKGHARLNDSVTISQSHSIDCDVFVTSTECFPDVEPKFAEMDEPSKVGTLSEDKPGKTKKAKNKPPNQRQPSAPDQENPGDLLALLDLAFGETEAGIPSEDKSGKTKRSRSKAATNRRQVSASSEGERQKKRSSSSTPAPQKRQDFMQYNCKVSFNHRTAHKKLVVSNHYHSLSVSEQPQVYPDLPERFFNCCQALGLQWFANGRRYWEVGIQGPSFWAVGVACAGIDRSGSSSRLGRNPLSWCVESFGQKLSAWHAAQQVVLTAPLPTVIGVFLDFEAGEVAFFSVGTAMLLLFRFPAQLQGQVFPAFWLCSSGTKLTLGQ